MSRVVYCLTSLIEYLRFLLKNYISEFFGGEMKNLLERISVQALVRWSTLCLMMSSVLIAEEEFILTHNFENEEIDDSYYEFQAFNTFENEEPIVAKLNNSLYSSEITPEIWKEVKPYLINEKNPIKLALDKMFAKSRIIESVEALESAGFTIIFQQLHRGLVVARHPDLRNYLLKMYLDTSPRTEWPLWVLRAKGARVIKKILDKYFYNHCMKVPEKWIYPVPKQGRPTHSDTVFPKDFILVVGDMKLASTESTLYRFKHGMIYARLRALYTVITEGGLSDSHIGNVPFSKDGKIAFIDTEYVNSWPVHLEWLTDYFSSMNQQYWKWIIEHGT
jgi:hypothetical protein